MINFLQNTHNGTHPQLTHMGKRREEFNVLYQLNGLLQV